MNRFKKIAIPQVTGRKRWSESGGDAIIVRKLEGIDVSGAIGLTLKFSCSRNPTSRST